MYSPQEAAAVRQKFWTSFGKYISPVPDAHQQKINWINYKTGVKGIYFKMDADNNQAYVAVEILLQNESQQQQYFDVFVSLKKQFEKAAGKHWSWNKSCSNANGKTVSRIWTELNEVNIFRENDWPAIISFLKTNVLALDFFWKEHSLLFEMAA